MDIESYYVQPVSDDDIYVSWSIYLWEDTKIGFHILVRDLINESMDRWKVLCESVRSFSLHSNGDDTFFVLKEKHPLIKYWIEPSCKLHCVKGAMDSGKILSALLVTHNEIFGDLVPPHKFLNTENFGANILDWNFGVIAEGPTFLMDAYCNSLKDIVESCNCFGHRDQEDWDGAKYVTRPKNTTGVCFGNSFVICDKVSQELAKR